jgi:DNA-binding transcriptional LysR family regulator
VFLGETAEAVGIGRHLMDEHVAFRVEFSTEEAAHQGEHLTKILGLRSAVGVGLGITVRTGLLLGPGLADVGNSLGLPVLPEAALSLYLNPESDPSPARDDFIALCRQAFQAAP